MFVWNGKIKEKMLLQTWRTMANTLKLVRTMQTYYR